MALAFSCSSLKKIKQHRDKEESKKIALIPPLRNNHCSHHMDLTPMFPCKDTQKGGRQREEVWAGKQQL